MIIGIGCDLCNIDRIAQSIEKYGIRFLQRILSSKELTAIAGRQKSPREFAAYVAKRFAAKEACTKALGTGFQKGTFWRDMQITTLPGGQPHLELSGGAAQNLQELSARTPTHIMVTMSDDYPWAQAFVVIETI